MGTWSDLALLHGDLCSGWHLSQICASHATAVHNRCHSENKEDCTYIWATVLSSHFCCLSVSTYVSLFTTLFSYRSLFTSCLGNSLGSSLCSQLCLGMGLGPFPVWRFLCKPRTTWSEVGLYLHWRWRCACACACAAVCLRCSALSRVAGRASCRVVSCRLVTVVLLICP